jgi:hypothetical protein
VTAAISTPARDRALALAVALAVFGLWATGLRGPYHFDDHVTPLDDPASRGPGAFVAHLATTLRPVTKLTYALEAGAGLDGAPAARRAVSAAAHAAGAGLLLLLLLALAPGASRAGPVLLALVYGVHPVHAEAVLAVAGRSATLAGALCLGALLAHVRGRLRLAAALYLLAGLARETAALALLVLIAAELALGARPWREHARRLAPALVAAAVLAAWLGATPRYRHLADYSVHGRPVGRSAVQQVAAVPVGLSLYARPAALSIDHGVPLPSRPGAPLFLAGLALFAAAAAAVVLAARRRAALAAVGLGLWLAALLPTQSVVPKLDPLTERPLGLALAALALAAAAVPWPARARRALLVASGAAAALLAAATVQRGQLYRSDLALWADAARTSRANPRPHVNHGLLLLEGGRPAEARAALARARCIAPLDLGVAALAGRLAARGARMEDSPQEGSCHEERVPR